MTTFLVQLSDLHIREPGRLAYRRVDTAAYLRTAVQSVLRLKQPPHAVVITGDLVDFGRPEEYAHLAQLLEPLPMPVYLLPGNHDDRMQMRAAFPGHRYLGEDGFVQFVVQVGGLTVVALDTVTSGESGGGLCPQRLSWLSSQLEAHRHDRIVVAMHHPPFATLIGHMDEIGLQEGATELEALVMRHPNVERVLCGHMHRPIEVRFGGTIAQVAPSPAHQVCLDLDPAAPSAWALEPPAFRLLACPPAGPVVSHLAYCGEFDGPHPFYEEGALIG
jgi:3',5'-cyclic-AMP phosphodiesterase